MTPFSLESAVYLIGLQHVHGIALAAARMGETDVLEWASNHRGYNYHHDHCIFQQAGRDGQVKGVRVGGRGLPQRLLDFVRQLVARPWDGNVCVCVKVLE